MPFVDRRMRRVNDMGTKTMKRFIVFLILMGLIAPFAICGRGGDAAIGGFAGSMVGSVIGGAMTRDRGSSRDREDAREARDEARDMRRERDRRRYNESQRAQDRRGHSSRTSPMVLFLIGLIIVLGVALVVLGFLLMKKRI